MNARAFDLAGPLPSGVTVLEASAGTGKTYAIAGLVARYVAEGWRLPRLLVVTFTRAATAELRDRVRGRLVEAADHLEQRLAGFSVATADPVLRLLAHGSDRQLRIRHRRLAVALTEFDAATVATIHGFCQHVLGGIGLAGDVDRAPVLLEDQTDVVEAVVDDLLVRTFHRGREGQPQVSRAALLDIAEAVVGSPDARIEPRRTDDPEAALRSRLAAAVRDEVDRRKRTLGVLSYDDVLTRLAGALRHPVHGDTARRRLRGKYDVALIDEFQDTDPVQWDIMSEVFGRDGRSLVLIGDPKQAIYAFRGADVHTYLGAARTATQRATLDVNWRSDGALLEAYNLLFHGAELGDGIAYRPVRPARAHVERRLVGAPEPTPLRVRFVRRDGGLPVSRYGYIDTTAARAHIARDVAAEIVRLLGSGAQLIDRRPDGIERRRREVSPPDVAVLVRANAEATLVQRTLRDAGVPAVINGVGSVFATTAAGDWLRLLEALERPGSGIRARAAALTSFLGWGADQVADADETAWEGVHERLHRWAGVLRDRSVASLLRTVSLEQRLPERLLARADGERLLTDLEHVGELLHAAATAEELGPAALSGWVRERVAEASEDTNPEERARRLESDADAVQVLTIHRSKGLEFPIVFAPFLWSSSNFAQKVPVCHAPGGRVVDVGGSGQAFDERADLAKRLEHGESLRLLYVALTRARHQAVVWWAPAGYATGEAPLSRMLLCRSSRDGAVINAGKFRIPRDDDAIAGRLQPLVERAGDTMSFETSAAHEELPRWSGSPLEIEDLEAATFHRGLDQRWRRTSYSAITAASHEPAVASEPEEPVVDDERLPGEAPADAADGDGGGWLQAVDVPLSDLAGGTAFGTFVHHVLEAVDFGAADLDAEIAAHVDHQQAGRYGDAALLVEGLRRAIETPLGPLVGDTRLCDVARADRLDELAFELPLVGGADPTGEVAAAAIGDLLALHLPTGDPLAGYAERLGDPAFRRQLRGYLTGSIDLVVRLRGDDGTPRFAVVDYKTNRLAGFDEPLTAWHYRPAALAEAMQGAHYPLQALLYAVALHRYLRWRLAGYDPERHLAGILYLFVRGMTGGDVPRVGDQPCGVFAWRPPAVLVTDVSDLLDRGRLAA